ncbi:MAG TPA: hypothetical protein PKI75_01760 [Candidatus Woesebacteria bacterium]|nr:hypothetical protein [Candidatus Woesebacteria bacterium]
MFLTKGIESKKRTVSPRGAITFFKLPEREGAFSGLKTKPFPGADGSTVGFGVSATGISVVWAAGGGGGTGGSVGKGEGDSGGGVGGGETGFGGKGLSLLGGGGGTGWESGGRSVGGAVGFTGSI